MIIKGHWTCYNFDYKTVERAQIHKMCYINPSKDNNIFYYSYISQI
jgi:hypothetical protein